MFFHFLDDLHFHVLDAFLSLLIIIKNKIRTELFAYSYFYLLQIYVIVIFILSHYFAETLILSFIMKVGRLKFNLFVSKKLPNRIFP